MTTNTSIAGYMWPYDQDTLDVFDEPHAPGFLDRLLELASNESNYAYPVSKAFCMHYTKPNTARWAKKGTRIIVDGGYRANSGYKQYGRVM